MTVSIFALAALAAAQAGTPPSLPLPTEPTIQPSSSAMLSSSGSELLTNETIVTLVKAGLGPETVVAKISASKGNYDTSTNALIKLKQAGVPDPVIAAMLDRSKSPVHTKGVADNSSPNPLVSHSAGIYLLDPRGAGRMIRIDAIASNQVKSSNYWGFALTAGLSSMKKKVVIPNPTARAQSVNRRPTFYFYFSQTGLLAELGNFNSSLSASASSPNEFSLVRLEQKKDHREAAVGSINMLSRVKSGVDDKARIAFDYEDVAAGVFRVTSKTDLAPGEYGFISSVNAGADTDVVARIFDFSVN